MCELGVDVTGLVYSPPYSVSYLSFFSYVRVSLL